LAAAFSAARKNHLDLSVGISLDSAARLRFLLLRCWCLLSYLIGPSPMDLTLWPSAVAMVPFATLTASLVTTSGRSAWFVGVLALMAYLIFATALYLLPPTETS
jgi:Ca2+:H+ antiporter